MTYHFRCYVDDLDYHGALTRPQPYTVQAKDLDAAWVLAEDYAEKHCTDYGRVFEYTVDYVRVTP